MTSQGMVLVCLLSPLALAVTCIIILEPHMTVHCFLMYEWDYEHVDHIAIILKITPNMASQEGKLDNKGCEFPTVKKHKRCHHMVHVLHHGSQCAPLHALSIWQPPPICKPHLHICLETLMLWPNPSLNFDEGITMCLHLRDIHQRPYALH